MGTSSLAINPDTRRNNEISQQQTLVHKSFKTVHHSYTQCLVDCWVNNPALIKKIKARQKFSTPMTRLAAKVSTVFLLDPLKGRLGLDFL